MLDGTFAVVLLGPLLICNSQSILNDSGQLPSKTFGLMNKTGSKNSLRFCSLTIFELK